jgi:hypothetical protein
MPDRAVIGKQNLVPGRAALKAVRVRREQRQQGGIPKTEDRKPKETRRPKPEACLSRGTLAWLGRLLIRPSDFGLDPDSTGIQLALG